MRPFEWQMTIADWRRAPERAAECIAFMREIVTSPELEILRGHAVVEARPRGVHKGAAIRALARHPPFAGRRPVCSCFSKGRAKRLRRVIGRLRTPDHRRDSAPSPSRAGRASWSDARQTG